jgi:hypothetical protein
LGTSSCSDAAVVLVRSLFNDASIATVAALHLFDELLQ